MYVRLAFAVAAHLEPEILIIDEVLAVGDAQFQKKCLGKMKDVSGEGRTVIFVSHTMPTITSLCQRCILLELGQISSIGKTSDVVMKYYRSGGNSPASVDFSITNKPIGDEYVRLIAGAVISKNEQTSAEILIDEEFKIYMQYRILKQTNLKYVPNFHFYKDDGSCVFVSGATETEILPPGDYIAECYIPGSFLNEGAYFVGLALSSFESGVQVHFYEQNILSFNVRDPIEGTLTRNGYVGSMPGVVRPKLKWNVAGVK
jgi:lipopolysaccharide transport system ATP-binding protein